MEKMYKVYKIDLSFEPGLIHKIIVGATDKKYLGEHIENIVVNNNLQEMFDNIDLLKYVAWDLRIDEIPNCYTDKPHIILDTIFIYKTF